MEQISLGIKTILRQSFIKFHLRWQRSTAGIGCLGGGQTPGTCIADASHYIHAPQVPLNCKLVFDERKSARMSSDENSLMEVDPEKNQFRSLGPINMYSNSHLYKNECMASVYLHGTAAFNSQPTWGSSESPYLDDLPKYSPVPHEKPKLKWWIKLWKFREVAEPTEYCGEPISLTPKQVEDEVNRWKKSYPKKHHFHPLVSRINANPQSFQPKDIPGPYIPKPLQSSSENKLLPPNKKSWFESLFYKEPKTEVVYPATIPNAKVLTYEELCESIRNIIITPGRFDCDKRDPVMCFQQIPLPYYSHCTKTMSGHLAPAICPNDIALKTLVSPKVRKTSSTPSPQSSHESIGSKICPTSKSPPAPSRMVCDGTTPIDKMPAPFYSECEEPLCKPDPLCYEKSPEENVCYNSSCQKKEFSSGARSDKKQNQPFYSQCPQKHIPKFQEAKDD